MWVRAREGTIFNHSNHPPTTTIHQSFYTAALRTKVQLHNSSGKSGNSFSDSRIKAKMAKCKIEGCNRSKELNADGFCAQCARASEVRAAGLGNCGNSDSPSGSNIDMSATGFDLSKVDQMVQQ